MIAERHWLEWKGVNKSQQMHCSITRKSYWVLNWNQFHILCSVFLLSIKMCGLQNLMRAVKCNICKMVLDPRKKQQNVRALSQSLFGNIYCPSNCCIVGNWTCFSFLKTFHLSSKNLLQFKLTGGELQAFNLCVGVSLQSCLGHVWALSIRVIRATCGSLVKPAFMYVSKSMISSIVIVWSFLRLLKLHKLVVGKLLRKGLTRCHGVLDHGLNLHLNIPLMMNFIVLKHISLMLTCSGLFNTSFRDWQWMGMSFIFVVVFTVSIETERESKHIFKRHL